MFSKLYKTYTQFIKNYLWVLFVVVLIFVPLYPKFPLITIPGTYVAVRIEDFLMATVFLVSTPYLVINFRQVLKGPLERALLIYLLIGLFSVFSAVFLTQTTGLSINLLHWARRVEYMICFFLAVIMVKKSDKTDWSRLILVISGIVVIVAGIYGIGQKHLAWPVIITQNQEYAKGIALSYIPGGHINSTFAGHYDLATYLVFLLPALTVSIFLNKEIRVKIFFVIVFAFGLWLITNAVSRISIASFMGSLLITFVLARKFKEFVLISVICFLVFVTSPSLLGRYGRIVDTIRNRVTMTVEFQVYAQEFPERRQVEKSPTPVPAAPIVEDRSSSIRLNVEWPRAIRAFSKNPLFGTGYSSITLATDNDYLRALGETGVLGFVALIIIIARINLAQIHTLLNHKKIRPEDRAFLFGITGSVVGVLLNAVFIDIFEASKFAIVFWSVIGVYVGVLRKFYKFN